MTIIKNNVEKPIEEFLDNGVLNKLATYNDKIVFCCTSCGKKESKRVEVIRKKNMDLTALLCSRCNNKKTLMENYGVENQFQRKEVKEKLAETNLLKYGADNPAKAASVQEKMKKTTMERYGVENIFQDKNRIKDSVVKKYGVENVAHLKGIVKKRKVPFKKQAFERLKGRLEDRFILLTSFEDYCSMDVHRDNFQLKCLSCGTDFIFKSRSGKESSDRSRCPTCFPSPVGGSWEEDEVADFISSFYTGRIERSARILNGKEIDIYLPELNIGFEYNGLFWHTELSGQKDRKYHLNKQEEARSLGIQLFFINSNLWYEKKEIIQSIIKSKIVSTNRIFARKCIIKEVSVQEARAFLEANHIQGFVGSSVKIGLYYNDELVAITTFGRNRFGGESEWELYRFCNKLNTQVIGGFSKMLTFFERNYKPKSIITFSEKNVFSEGTYEAVGFIREKDSEPNYYYTYDYLGLESRMKYQKHKLNEELEEFDENLTEWENMVNNGFDRIWDCGNRVFVRKIND